VHRSTARILLFLISFLLVFFGTGCDQANLIQKFTSPQDESTARHYVDLLRQGRYQEIEAHADPSIQGPEMPDRLAAIAAFFPSGEPISVKVVGVNSFHAPPVIKTSITLEYEFPGKWLLANVVTQRKDATASLVGFHVTPITGALEKINRFTLIGKSAPQYTVFLLTIVAVGLSLYALMVCLRTKMGKGKWVWSILCLIGVGQVSINWTTGQTDFTLLSIHLPPAGAYAVFYGPWIIFVALPVGPVLFLMLHDRLEETLQNKTPGDAQPTA
jgi:hypothetical protein